MHNQQMSPEVPDLTLSLELAASLNWVIMEDDPLNEALHKALVQGMAELMETLGIPGIPVVQIAALSEKHQRPGRWMRLFVNGRLCRYADELLPRAYSYASGSPLPGKVQSAAYLEWLRELSHSTEAPHFNPKLVVGFLSLTCLEIIKMQPGVLLDLPQVVAYAASLPLPASTDTTNQQQPKLWPPDPAWLYPVLKMVLQLKISIADKQKVAKVLGSAREQSQEEMSENLIVVLRQDAVEIQLSQEYLKQLTTSDPTNSRGIFTSLREDLLQELGLLFPAFRFVPVDHLKPNSFAFKIHHLRMLPWMGSRSDALNHLKLCLTTNLRENAACFVDRQSVRELLGRFYYPVLAEAVQAKSSIEQITQVIRELILEGVSMRSLLAILERFLDYDYLIIDTSKIFSIDNRFATSGEPLNETWLNDSVNMISFIRMGLKRFFANKYSRGTNNLAVYLLDPKIEQLVLEYKIAGEDEKEDLEEQNDKILEAIRAEIARLPEAAQIPSILTSMDVRPFLREMIAAEFPQLAVLAHQEIPTDISIRCAATLSLDAI